MTDNFNDTEDMELDNIVVLTDEDGNETEFEMLDIIEYQDENYVVLIETDDDCDEVTILRIDSTENDEYDDFVGIDDEDILNAVFNIFKEDFKDEFNFED